MDVNSVYFSDKPQAFGGKYGLYTVFEKNKVDSALENNDIYTRFKQHKRSKNFSPIYVYCLFVYSIQKKSSTCKYSNVYFWGLLDV